MLQHPPQKPYNSPQRPATGIPFVRRGRPDLDQVYATSSQAGLLIPYQATDTRAKQMAELDRAIYLAQDVSMGPRCLKYARTLERQFLVEEFKNLLIRGESPVSNANLKKHQEELLEALPGFQERRRIELVFADKLEEASYETNNFLLGTQIRSDVAKMRDCRQGGYSGVDRTTGARRTMWDEKCGKVRLCPDESRAETQRMATRYIPAIMAWMNGSRTRRRAFYCVFTEPNFSVGSLGDEKRLQFKRFKEKFIDRKRECTDADRARHGYSSRKKLVKTFPQIAGSLVIQEDPLSAGRDWNVHLNVILLVDGSIDFAEMREAWGNNVEIRELKPEVKDLTSTFLEIIKYAVQFTASKTASKKASGASEAPGLLEWSSIELLEWYQSQQAFRRTRSYGALFRLKKEEESLEASETETQWITRFQFSGDGTYYVDLILENNFFDSGVKKTSFDKRNNGPPGQGRKDE
ncbi:MAG: hypothetical protein JKY86_07620 [Gammaproteobacteria bacterium]|nr:hypothetical protein [Gammaproteobacteria bacterium]